jgi:histone H3/H4
MGESKRVSNTRKAGLKFPVGRARRCLSDNRTRRVSNSAAVALAAMQEYLIAELIERPCELTREAKKQRLTPQQIRAGIAEDEEMAELLKHALVVVPPRKRVRRAAAAAAK